jgi:hypothetical protein
VVTSRERETEAQQDHDENDCDCFAHNPKVAESTDVGSVERNTKMALPIWVMETITA